VLEVSLNEFIHQGARTEGALEAVEENKSEMVDDTETIEQDETNRT
jgi:hypothetical protein